MVYVPRIDDPDFLRLEKIINADFEAIEILSNPIDGEEALDCFNIVQRQVDKFGGKRILGWQIWKHNTLIEAEAHAVWEDLDGILQDISPKQFNLKFDTILFVEDSSLEYQGRRIDNIRLNIASNKVVDDIIKLNKLLFDLKNKGERYKYDRPSDIMNESEINELTQVVQKIMTLQKFINSGNSEKSKCYCGGSKSYKNCHGKNFNS